MLPLNQFNVFKFLCRGGHNCRNKLTIQINNLNIFSCPFLHILHTNIHSLQIYAKYSCLNLLAKQLITYGTFAQGYLLGATWVVSLSQGHHSEKGYQTFHLMFYSFRSLTFRLLDSSITMPFKKSCHMPCFSVTGREYFC